MALYGRAPSSSQLILKLFLQQRPSGARSLTCPAMVIRSMLLFSSRGTVHINLASSMEGDGSADRSSTPRIQFVADDRVVGRAVTPIPVCQGVCESFANLHRIRIGGLGQCKVGWVATPAASPW